jgi:asparagine synthase (glutamine-hydrolysing)
MSVQFGRWRFDGGPASPDYLARVHRTLAAYGPDGSESYSSGGVTITCHAFHTTKESRREIQPHLMASGAVLAWDGRLDNRAEFTCLRNDILSMDSPDLSFVAAAYERWGTDCFAKLVGDWALSIWHPQERLLILARDPLSAGHLYYSVEDDHITWCTSLDPLVLFSRNPLVLNQEYIAGWLAFFPSADLTPYQGIYAVPPSSFVRLGRAVQTVTKYWDFDPAKRIRYRSDAEYEEHFRFCFSESVKRRLRSDAPVLAELSGGMDSSSIVCVADDLLAQGAAETSRLDTVSYYDDNEPHWNERPYFTKVEERRGRTGCHIDIGSRNIFDFTVGHGTFPATPGCGRARSKATDLLARCIRSHGNRVVLSGVGGDEVLGGVPSPVPELADLLAQARFKALVDGLRTWALNKRRPWFYLLFETAQGFLPEFLRAPLNLKQPAPWLIPRFVHQHRAALTGYEHRLRLFGALPSFQENLSTLEGLRRQLGCTSLSPEPLFDERHPYLDRDLLEFLYAIPRQQLVRPGQRRSLLRRALAGIVPDEILSRRKAFVSRSPVVAISKEWLGLMEVCQRMVTASSGIIDREMFISSLQKSRHQQSALIVALMRTLWIEVWLKRLSEGGVPYGDNTAVPDSLEWIDRTLTSAEKI